VAGATMAGALTGATETVLHNPFEVLKVRLQAREHSHLRNTMAIARDIIKAEGPLGLYRGFEVSTSCAHPPASQTHACSRAPARPIQQAYLLRQSLWNGCFFGSIAAIRRHLPDGPSPSPGPGQPFRSREFWVGLVAGSFATVLNTPLDVAKTRIQNRTSPPGFGQANYSCQVIAAIYRDEGFRACFKGLNARLYR
jgi:solute carrier family 25 (mitochondrial 2-oxodicarboxylate transporter), member 21